MKIRVLFILGIVVLIITGINLVRFLEHTGKQRRFLEQPAKPEAPYSDQARDDDVRSGAPAHIPTNAGAAVKARLLTPEEQAILDQAEATGADEETLEEIRTNIEPISQMVKVFSYPIEFYGKVVDENGEPVGGATATYSTFSKMFEDSEKLSVQSASNGLFAINAQGGSIFVSVSKSGYYRTGESQKGFGYAVPSTYPPADNPDEPAVFYLRKRGESEPLIYVGRRQYEVPPDGSKVSVNLRKGSLQLWDEGPFYVQSWIDAENMNEAGHFDWRFKFTIPGGGFLERVDQFSFLAPENGYEESVEFRMTQSINEKWKFSQHRDFFVKLKNGTFSRVKITLHPSPNISPIKRRFLCYLL